MYTSDIAELIRREFELRPEQRVAEVLHTNGVTEQILHKDYPVLIKSHQISTVTFNQVANALRDLERVGKHL